MSSGAGTGAISIRDVTKIYDPEGVNVLAVDHCSLEIGAGEVCMIVGPSGCGKTTLLNAIAGFHSLTSGEIRLDGEVLCDERQPLASQGADRVVVFQNGALFPWKTLGDNVAYGPMVQGTLSRKEAREKARDMLAEAGLGDVADKYPGEVSSGMARRAEIVRALINNPKVLLLDEPYRAMDALTKSIMHEALLEMYDRTKVTIFFITHDLEEAIFLGRPRGGDDDTAVPGEDHRERRHSPPPRLPPAFVGGVPGAGGGSEGRGPRGSVEGVRSRRARARLSTGSAGATIHGACDGGSIGYGGKRASGQVGARASSG